MKYIVTPSLERIAILKVVSWLWNQNDIRALIANFSVPLNLFMKEEKWQEIEDKVLEKVSDLQQPECLKEKIAGVIRAVGLEILEWVEYYIKDNNRVLHLPSEFILTQLGTIDKQKTTELLIKDETIPIERRYRLACIFCLKDYLPELWHKLPEDFKDKFFSKVGPRRVNEHLFVVYFTYALTGELSKFLCTYEPFLTNQQSLCVFLFEEAIRSFNKVAVKYFYKRMPSTEKQLYLLKAAEKVANNLSFSPDCIEILCFLLSQMDQVTHIKFFRGNIEYALDYILLSMLDWPWQGFLIGTINLSRSLVSQSSYEQLLKRIIYKVINGDQDYFYQDIFSELCMQIPDEERMNIVHKVCASTCLLTDLFKIKDKQNMKLILQDATPEVKYKFLVSSNGIGICCKLMMADQWNLLELLIEDCVSTKVELIYFKENFDQIIRCVLNCRRDVWSKFICLSDNLVRKYDKRKCEEEINSKSSKKTL